MSIKINKTTYKNLPEQVAENTSLATNFDSRISKLENSVPELVKDNVKQYVNDCENYANSANRSAVKASGYATNASAYANTASQCEVKAKEYADSCATIKNGCATIASEMSSKISEATSEAVESATKTSTENVEKCKTYSESCEAFEKQSSNIATSIPDLVDKRINTIIDWFSNNRSNGGILFQKNDCVGTLLGDFAGCSKEQLMFKYPFNAITESVLPSYDKNGTSLGIDDYYINMPNCWFYEKHSEDGSSELWVANYKVNDNYQRYYGSEISYLSIGAYFGDIVDGHMHSRPGVIPTAGVNQVTLMADRTYYKINSKIVVSTYMRIQVWMLYAKLVDIYLANRNSQQVYRGICDYSWSKGSYSDITDERSQYTGVTEETDSVGRMSKGICTGEITGTSTTASLTSGKRPFKVLGVENPYGMFWQNLYGIGHNSSAVRIYTGTDILTNDDLKCSSTLWEDTGLNIPTTSSGWQTSQQSYKGIQIPLALNGSDSKNVGDYYWYNSGTNMLFFVGGNFDDGSHVGLRYLNANSGFGYANSGIGFRPSLLW